MLFYRPIAFFFTKKISLSTSYVFRNFSKRKRFLFKSLFFFFLNPYQSCRNVVSFLIFHHITLLKAIQCDVHLSIFSVYFILFCWECPIQQVHISLLLTGNNVSSIERIYISTNTKCKAYPNLRSFCYSMDRLLTEQRGRGITSVFIKVIH